MTVSTKRFLVGLSFPGEKRELVAEVAGHLAAEIGRERVLYDKFYEAEFARPNLDTHLQRLYHDDSELVVVFLGGDYERKEWPGLEWRAIRDLIKKKQAASIMLVHLDHAAVSGVFSIDGYIDAEGRAGKDIAALIMARLKVLRTEGRPLVPSDLIPPQGPDHAANTKSAETKGKIPQPIRDVLNRGVDFFNNGSYNKAKAEFVQAVALAEDAKHNLAIVDAKEHLSLVLIAFEHDIVGAKALLQSCLDVLATESDDEEKAEVLERLARVHEQGGDLELSESLLRQSLAISERLGDKQAQGGTLVCLAWTVGRRGRTDEALDLNRRAYDLLVHVLHELKPGDTRQTEFVHTILGNLFFQRAKVHQRRAEPDEAEKALETALGWQRKIQANHELAKLLRELAELKFFRQQWTAGVSLLQEAATIYQEREILAEFAECLHIMGRVHATLGHLEKAGEFLSAAAGAAVESGRGEEAAEVLLSLAHLAMEQRDAKAARELFESAKTASGSGEFQAKCLMELSRLAAKEGHEGEQRQLVRQAVDALKAELADTKPEMERAKQYFTLGWYLREAGDVEEALSCVRKAGERFAAAGDAYGAAKASFEAAGLLDHMGRKAEAREACRAVQNLVQGKPFFDIAAAVDIELAKFAFYDDKNLAEADRLLRRGLELCKEHELPLLAEALLLRDELEHTKLAGTDAAASIPDLLDFLHQQIALCPTNKEGYLRFWAFSEARKLDSALAGSLGPNVAIVTDDMTDFLQLSAILRPYRDWSLIVPPTRYPENIRETIPISGEMLVPANVPFLVRSPAGAGKDSPESSDPSGLQPTVRRGREVLAELAVSHLSRGAAIARYFAVVLEEESEEFGGAKLGVHGESLALPPVVHDLLQGRTVEELKAHRLFFVYYNRGHLDEAKRLWSDLAIMKSYRCLPVYRTALPKSQDVRVVASCSVMLPVLDKDSAETHKRLLRRVRRELLEVLAAGESTAAGKLSDLEATTEDLVEKVGESPSIELKLYMLAFEYEGATRTHAAIVIN